MLRLEEANNFKTFEMVGPSLNAPKPPTIKFLCSYGGRILPRYPDGKLRYHGGHTRVLAVTRSISFCELMVKLGELCGKTVSLRCQLPTEDLDALVSITSDEDLMNLVEEYDRIACVKSSSVKIRAFLSIPKKCSPTHSTSTSSGSGCGSSSSTSTPEESPKSPSLSASYSNRSVYTSSKPPVKLPFCYNKSAGKLPYIAYRYSNRCCLIACRLIIIFCFCYNFSTYVHMLCVPIVGHPRRHGIIVTVSDCRLKALSFRIIFHGQRSTAKGGPLGFCFMLFVFNCRSQGCLLMRVAAVILAGHSIRGFDCVMTKEAFKEIGQPTPKPVASVDS